MEKELAKKQAQGELNRLETQIHEKTTAYIKRPQSTADIAATTEPTTRYFDPSITVPYTIRDAEGVTIHPAGTTVNPLDYMSMTSRLLFFDGDDSEQVAWVKKLIDTDQRINKLILTQGSPTHLMTEWRRRVAFDQGALLTTKLGILQVPALVYQEHKHLRIDELMPK